MESFLSDFTKDVPRGVSSRFLSQQYAPKAQWMDFKQIVASEVFAYDAKNPGEKVLIGALDKHLIGIKDDRHILTVAGSRSGKSVGLISNLMFYQGSVLATDPKAELAKETAERRYKMGQKIYVLDPFMTGPDEIDGFRVSYNPLSILRLNSSTFLEDAALIADAIVVQSGHETDPHWNESAKNFIEGVIIHVATAARFKDSRNLIEVRELIKKTLWKLTSTDADPPEKKEAGAPKIALFEDMKRNARILEGSAETKDIGSALIAAAMDFYNKGETEMAGVLSTINRHTKFLDYSAFRNVLKDSDFDLGELKRNPKGVSVYLCFPATRAEISKRWMRIFVNQFLDAMDREKTKPAIPVLACLDEFPVLGYMSQLESAVGLIASFGVKLWIIIQDWSQGKALYGDRWETFAANAGVMQFFGNNDLATTEYISRRLGKTQVEVVRVSEVSFENRDKGVLGQTPAIELHDLLMPDEITRQFSRNDRLDRQLILWAGYHPMILQRVIWHKKGGIIQSLLRAK